LEKPTKKVIIINGSGGVGKDAFAKRVIEETLKLSKRIVPVENEDYCVDPEVFYRIDNIITNNISTIDCVKNIAKMFNWNGEKSEKDRKMLSDLKDLMTVYNDYPFKRITAQITDWLRYDKTRPNDMYDHSFLFVHCREPKEIERIKNQFPNDTFTLLVQNPKVAKVTGNHADKEVENYNYDFTVVNDSDLRALRKVAIDFYKKIFNQGFTKYKFVASDYDFNPEERDI
jgi:hypothetical protein